MTKIPSKQTYQLKTKAALIADGWTTEPNGRLVLEGRDKKTPIHSLSAFQVRRLLGKSAAVLDVNLGGETPTYEVKFDDYSAWMPWDCFVEAPPLTKPPAPTFKVLETKRGSVKIFDDLDEVKTDCSYSTMDKKTALQVAKWVVSVLQ